MKSNHTIGCLLLGLGLLAPLSAQPAQPAPAAAPGEGIFGDATLRDWVQPEYPAAARAAKLEGKVVVEFVVELDGHVTRARVKESTNEQFNASALAAVQRWVFGPALADGQPVASGMQVPVVYRLAQLTQKRTPLQPPLPEQPVGAPVTPPKLLESPDPEYPAELENRYLPGMVAFEFFVEPDGTMSGTKLLWTPHAAFVDEALRTLEKYRFEPAHQGPLPVKSTPTQGQMEFKSLGMNRTELLAANHITVVDPERFREPPRPAVLPEPVYPWPLLEAGESGSATVEFTVTERGLPTEIVLRDASRPEFGAALVAAVAAWRFDAALAVSERTAAKLVAAHQFVPPAGGSTSRLVEALKPGGAGVRGSGGLDQRLRPLWLVQPVYPPALRGEKPVGKAVIDFIVDPDGRARLPRVVSASHDEFGWAAATAVSQWVFARPLRAGQPTDVKVSVPFEFSPPQE